MLANSGSTAVLPTTATVLDVSPSGLIRLVAEVCTLLPTSLLPPRLSPWQPLVYSASVLDFLRLHISVIPSVSVLPCRTCSPGVQASRSPVLNTAGLPPARGRASSHEHAHPAPVLTRVFRGVGLSLAAAVEEAAVSAAAHSSRP